MSSALSATLALLAGGRLAEALGGGLRVLVCIELRVCRIPDLDLKRSPNATFSVFSVRTCPLRRYNTSVNNLYLRLVECIGSYPQLYGSSKKPTALFNIL